MSTQVSKHWNSWETKISCPKMANYIISYTHRDPRFEELWLTIPFNSCTTNTRDADGSGEGVCDGTDTLGIEAEVSYINPSIYAV
jgi:hypothetical protein